MLFIGRWDSTQLMPRFTCTEWLKYTKSGTRSTCIQGMDCPLCALSRTSASRGSSFSTWLWQFMHVELAGILEYQDFSTALWQYRQSTPNCPACVACENDTACIGWQPTRRCLAIR